MNNNTVVSSQQENKHVGILLCDLGQVNLAALKFLILELNKLQHSFEYEFLPVPVNDPFIQKLSNQVLVDTNAVFQESLAFLKHYRVYLHENNELFKFQGVKEEPIDYLVLVTMACFSSNFYAMYASHLAVLAFGNWKRSMAPPSILEFILTMSIAASVYSVSPSIHDLSHLGTKGCLFDFTPDLGEARLKVLSGFVCNRCRTALQSDGLASLADELASILEKKWLGKSTEPNTPAGIIAKLGADLFATTGLKPTAWEVFKTTLQEEWVKQLLTLIVTVGGAILIAFLIIRFGLK